MASDPTIQQPIGDQEKLVPEIIPEQLPSPYAEEGALIVIPRTTFNYVIIGLACLAVGILLGTTVFNPMRGNELTLQTISQAVADGISKSPTVQTAQNQAVPQNINVSADDDPFWGPKDAPVTIVEFSDFQCPYCGRFHKDTYEQLRKNYEGKIRFVYRDFPILSLHPYAEVSAQAADCANEQGKYWEYHDLLLSNQDKYLPADLTNFASQLNLDGTAFTTCISTGRYKQEIAKDVQDGESYGVTGTPTFFINGQALVGAQPYTVFASAIDAELAKANTSETILAPG